MPAKPTPAAIMQAVVDVIREMTGGKPGAPFARADLAAAIAARQAELPALASLDLAYEGARARDGNLAGVLKRLAASGLISSGRKGPCKVVDLGRKLPAPAPRR